jgi:hypothetical protein
MTAVNWQRTKYGALAHCRPGGKGDTDRCPTFQGEPAGPAPAEMVRCDLCLHWAAGITHSWYGWVTPAVVADGHALKELAWDKVRAVIYPGSDVRYWTVDEQGDLLPAETAMFLAGWRRLRVETHVPREAM